MATLRPIFTITLAISLAALCIGGLKAAHRPAHHAAPTWQSSQSPVIQVGVRDKFGDLGNYKATFRVTGPGNKISEVTRSATKDGWASANFPDDFSPAPYLEAGSYKWYCFVNGKAVVSDNFRVSFTKAGEQITLLH